jgi:hypothetical protein
MNYIKHVFIIAVLLLPISTLTSAQEPIATQTIELSKEEPSIGELQRAAIRYAEVEPGKITNWRKQAAMKALLPDISVGYDTDTYRTINAYNYGGNTMYTVGPDDAAKGWDVSASWDLGNLIYNDDQTSIDSRSKLMVQLRNDVLDELNAAYFERKKLQRQLDRLPDKTSETYLEREIKIEELTATIDGLTGGYLSRRLGEE